MPGSARPDDSSTTRDWALTALVLTPVVVIVAVIGLLALSAWWFGGYPPEMFYAAAAVGLPAAGVTAFLLYRLARARSVTQTSLRSAEARVTGIVEAAMDPMIAIDERQRVVLFNAAAEAAFQWPRRAVVGQSIDMLIPTRFRGEHRRHVERFGRTGVTSRRMGGSTVLTALRANGDEFPIEASISQHREAGERIFTVILRDITERATAERQLAQSEARLRGILDSAMDAIITVDEAQRVVLFNAAAEKMFGCPAEQAIGAPLAWFIPARFRDTHAGHVQRFGAAGVSSRRMGATRIVMGLRRSGDEFPIDASISQIEEHGVKFYTVILRDVSERVKADDELRRSKDELKELATAAGSAREQEKMRIARELHDELAQAMTGLKMDLSMVRMTLPGAGAEVASRLDKMDRQIDVTIASMRRIAADLRPLALDDLGLVPALESLVDTFNQRSGVACELALSHPDFELTDAQATAVFRIVQESLTNVAKHANATQVEVTVENSAGELVVTVRDNGAGFPADAPVKPNSYGLLGLRERAYLLGGEVRTMSAPGSGTEIEVRLPLAASEASA
ncbi:MAG TPA: PAS domain-containing sensor histidine kinase [Casimicrobiaceae bacterium]|nr:PAS domain-containing sensor histidine kinase [Casimicrobiaceae bacterium]